jgi:hypothetical protein
MAYPTAVNSQITDSITQADLEVIGLAPAIAMGMLYQATSQAMANSILSSSTAQQQGDSLMIATTALGVAVLGKMTKAVSG